MVLFAQRSSTLTSTLTPHTEVYSSFTHSRQSLATTQVSFSGWQINYVHPDSGTSFSDKREMSCQDMKRREEP